MKRIEIFLLALLLLAGFFARIWQIDKVPASLYIDEADFGLQARSLIQTFKDYRGGLTPFWVHSFNDVRTPIPAYLVVLSSLIFRNPELQVRAPSVFLGVIVVFIVFLLVRLWTKNFTASIFTAATFAANPWQIQFSRFAHENISMMALYLVAIFFFFKTLQTKNFKFLIIFSILLPASIYAYRTMSLFVPLTFFALFLLFRKELLFVGLKKLILIIVIAGVIILPFLAATTIGAPDQPRFAQLSVTADPEVPIFVQIDRAVDTKTFADPTATRKPVASSFFFHNKVLSWFEAFKNNYLETFSTDFLFIKGDRNLRHSVGKMGHLYYIDLIAIIFGFVFLAKNFKRKEFQWLAVWLLITPIPSSLTLDGVQHAARLFNFSAPILLIIGLGWWHLFETFKKLNYGRLMILPIVALAWLVLFTFYLHRYFVHYPVDSARHFGYGFKEAAFKILEVEKDYQRIAMVSSKDPPMIYFFYWSKTNPRLIQEYGLNFSKDVVKNHPLDKYKVVDWPPGIGSSSKVAFHLRSDTLYLVSQNELPQDLRKEPPPEGIKLVSLITYPDREVAFYLITRDAQHEAAFSDPRFSKGIDIL